MEVRFTNRELDIMEVLWSRGPSTAGEVQETLADDLAYNTVLTMLGVLEDKGYVSRDRERRAHRYAPTVEREDASQSELDRVTRRLFDGSPEAVLLQMVDRGKLSEDQLRRMRDLLQSRLEKEDES